MTRDGYVVDTRDRTVSNIHAGLYALDRLEIAGGRLFYARAIAADPLISLQETWLLPQQGWTISRFTFHEHRQDIAFDWKLEPDRTERDGHRWRVNDGFLDLVLYEGSHYHLEDADELADAVATEAMALEEGLRALRALDTLCRALQRHHYSGRALLHEYAPGLPQ